jgi:hypothetical protein
MAEAPPSPVSSDKPARKADPMSLGLRKQKLADMLEGKLDQGYEIEDRTDTEATLVDQGRRRRRWFGASRSGEKLEQRLSVDEAGVRISRQL